MERCDKFKVKINGKWKTFNSDRELDLFLKSNQDKYKIDEVHKTFSIDPMAEALANLEKARVKTQIEETKDVAMQPTMEELKEGIEVDISNEKYTKVPNSMSVTQFNSTFGKPDNWAEPAVTPYNKEAIKNFLLTKYRITNTEAEAQKMTQDTLNSYEQQTQYGTDVHDYMESIIKGVSKEFKLDGGQFRGKAERFIRETIDKHTINGKKPEVFSEYAIQSKELDRELIKATGDKFKTLHGRMDLLIIDSAGKAHIYDFKVSKREVGDWDITENYVINKGGYWHSTKKYGTASQLAYYRRILEQHGVRVGTTNVVPIKLDLEYEDDNINIKGVRNIVIGETLTNVKGTRPGSRMYRNIYNMLPSQYEVGETGRFSTTISKTAALFPIANKKFTSINQDRNVDFLIKDKKVWNHVDSSTEKGQEGYKYQIFFNRIKGSSSLFYKTKEEFEAGMKEYADAITSSRGQEMKDIANAILEVQDGTMDITEISGSDKNAYVNFIARHFDRYIKNDWKLLKIDELIQNGYFVFQKHGRTEVLLMTDQTLRNVNELARGTSLLGQWKSDTTQKLKQVLPASNANIEMMKAMIFITENPELFTETQIDKIDVINPWHRSNVFSYNEDLVFNYQQLRQYSSDSLKNIPPNLFSNNVESKLRQADAIVEYGSDWKAIGDLLKNDANKAIIAKKDIKALIDELIRSNGRKGGTLWNAKTLDPNNDDVKILFYLTQAYLAVDGYKAYDELDVNKWLQGVYPTGGYLSSPDFSRSRNVQQMADIVSRYSTEVRQGVAKKVAIYEKPLRDLYNSNKLHIEGGEANIFKEFLRRDPTTGKVDSRLLWKTLDDPYFVDRPKEKKVMELYFKIWEEYRYNNNETDISAAKANDSYYEVPLMPAKFVRQVKNDKLAAVAKNIYKEAMNLIEGLSHDQTEMKQKYEADHQSLFNRFNTNEFSRQTLLDSQNTGYWEFDLERILINVIEEYEQEKASARYIPAIQGLQMALHVYGLFANGEAVIPNVEEVIQKYLTRTLYESPIMDESLIPAYRVMSIFKDATSKLMLGGNFRSGIRELIQGGLFIGAVRAFSGQMGDHIDVANYTKAYTYILTEFPSSINKIHFVEWLNAEYGMANISINEIAEYFRLNQLGIRNFGSHQLFFAAKMGDFLHRMTFLIGKMMKDGSWEAHSANEETGKAEYDFYKDSRYTKFVEGDVHHPDYAKQKALYLVNMEKFNEEGIWGHIDYTPGEKPMPLPRAYTHTEGKAMKVYADLLYGHYDLESRALLNSTFLGAFFIQFQTFTIGKLEQWFLKPGLYNIESPKQQYLDGERLWRVERYPVINEDGTFSGFPEVDFVKESLLQESDKKFASLYMEFEAQPLEGIWFSMMSYAKDIFSLDSAGLKEHWDDPVKRANLVHFLSDIIGMIILGYLVKWAFDWKNLKDEGVLKNYAAQIAYGSTQDGPILNIIDQLVGDLNPPTKSTMEKLWNSTGSMIIGDVNMWQWLTTNVGAIREFRVVSNKMTQ